MKESMKHLPGSLPAKVAAFILAVIMTCLAVASVLGAAVMWSEEIYTRSKDAYQQSVFESVASPYQRSIYELVLDGDPEEAADYCKQLGASGASVLERRTDTASEEVALAAETELWNFGVTTAQPGETFTRTFIATDETLRQEGVSYEVRLICPDEMLTQGAFGFAGTIVDWGYTLRYSIYVIGALTALLAVICFVFLMNSAGYRNGREELQTSFITRMPWDILIAILSFVGVGGIRAAEELTYWTGDWSTVFIIALFVLAALTVVLGFCYDFAVRVKRGRWWRNTVIYMLLRLAWRCACAMGQGIAAFFLNLPLIWKTVLLVSVLSFAEFFGIAAVGWDTGNLLFLWFLEKLVLVPAVFYLAVMLRKLEKGGQALSSGDLSYQVDTRKMLWNFKRHGENLNSIAGGMTAAVEERLKSERLKTELITNVSHDIKTPLTSIINYADLIGREPTDNEKITEYALVLHRQSERLKKLIEDLVEASKASTGNLEVLLAPCEPGVLVTQTAGEYEQRLAAQELALVTRQPETPVKIMADGRRLWRVFDNLMSNVCKYAKSGTRVYLSVEEQGGDVLITLKNTSREPLNLTAGEFMERFVRGDSSRSTEGSGLGLSIAKSLTELQNGTLELTVDGDLFKVELRFKKI